jgi:hypothetical protein
MGSFENFETYHPIVIPNPDPMLARLQKEKGRLINERFVWEVSKISKLTIRSRLPIPDSMLARLQKEKGR